MQKFSFKTQKDLLIPQTRTIIAFKDADGNQLSGDELLKRMGNMCEKWESEVGMPVPIPNQRWIAWLKQAKRELDGGMSSDEYFKKSIIGA